MDAITRNNSGINDTQLAIQRALNDVQQVMAYVCSPFDCNQHGICSNGTCVCYPGRPKTFCWLPRENLQLGYIESLVAICWNCFCTFIISYIFMIQFILVSNIGAANFICRQTFVDTVSMKITFRFKTQKINSFMVLTCMKFGDDWIDWVAIKRKYHNWKSRYLVALFFPVILGTFFPN